MGIEYKIHFHVPEGYSTTLLLRRLPAAETAVGVAAGQMPAYHFALESDGFYFLDHLSNDAVAALAMRMLIDEGLRHSSSVQISEL